MVAHGKRIVCPMLNENMESIRRLCAAHVTGEKWLIAPSLRTGYEWLDAVTRSGQAVLNARIKTFAGMALELAAPEMERRGLTYLRGIGLEVFIGGLMTRLRDDTDYLPRLQAGPGLVRAMSATLSDLRLSGLTAGDLSPGLFEVPAKGREITALLKAYEEELSSRNLVDLAGVIRLATLRLEGDGKALPGGSLVAIPEDMLDELHGLERALWEAAPEKCRVELGTGRPAEITAGHTSDSALLAWVCRPAEAPPPQGDGSVEIFRAVGEVNEVREVLRRCVEKGIPFDDVEMIHTDAATYIPLVYEVCSGIASEPGGPVPVTFAEGVPVRYSRPGRALAAWLSWIREGYPQATLVRMIQDGLLAIKLDGGVSFSRLGALLRALPIGRGRDRYLPAIDAELASLRWRSSLQEDAEDARVEPHSHNRLRHRIEMLQSLRDLLCDLLACLPERGDDPGELLDGAETFVARWTRGVNELDEYGRVRLLDDIRELASCTRESGAIYPDIHVWLAELARSARVEGKGPRPGCLYVSPLAGGGHSGRSHTFILGLDDGRFPGSGLQDPLLLDTERGSISPDLPTAAARLGTCLEDFARLAARLRGKVTMSYCCRSVSDGRDMFPSSVVLAAYRIISGDRDGVQDDLLAWLPEPASFAPRGPESCISAAEWWLWRLCGDSAPSQPEASVAGLFPHLGRGFVAARKRESDLFTEYDGYVPEAGADMDPASPQGPVLSASRLETLGRCPLEYFFAYILGIDPPEEHLADPYTWLEPTEKGSLLHAVFRRFLQYLHGENRRPELEKDWDTLRRMLGEEVNVWARKKPPPDSEVFKAEVEDLLLTARIFLQEEEESCRDRRPIYFEVAIGLEAEGEGNPIDTPEPVEIELPGGETIRTRGYIDRVDQLEGSGGTLFSVCDYKTGSSYRYRREDPFRQGRCVQNFIYKTQAEALLAECHPGAEVVSFQYFFPNTREHGERIEWESEALAGGIYVLQRLYDMLSRGCFPFSDDADDVTISDYRTAFGDIESAVERVKIKLHNPGNENLAPFRELRGYGESDDG
jgi:ATP-dependent helicase/nuclease subunit B